MGDDEDIVDVDVIEEDIDEASDTAPAGVTKADLDARRKLEEKLEEARLRKLTQDYDF